MQLSSMSGTSENIYTKTCLLIWKITADHFSEHYESKLVTQVII